MKNIPLVVLALLIVGCGGGGSGTPASSSQLASTIRTPTAGDKFVYSVSGTSTIGGTFTGTETISLASDVLNSVSCIRSTDTVVQNYSVGTSTAVQTTWETPAFVALGVQLPGSSSPLAVSSDTINYPTNVGANTAVAGNITLSDGTVISDSWAVQGSTSITVPAGTYVCWILNHSIQQGTGTVQTETDWYVPSLGQNVKSQVTVATSNSVVSYTEQLASVTLGS